MILGRYTGEERSDAIPTLVEVIVGAEVGKELWKINRKSES